MRNGICHKASALYHPATNGLTERFVQILKTSVRAMPKFPIEDGVAEFLFSYHTAVHAST